MHGLEWQITACVPVARTLHTTQAGGMGYLKTDWFVSGSPFLIATWVISAHPAAEAYEAT